MGESKGMSIMRVCSDERTKENEKVSVEWRRERIDDEEGTTRLRLVSLLRQEHELHQTRSLLRGRNDRRLLLEHLVGRSSLPHQRDCRVEDGNVGLPVSLLRFRLLEKHLGELSIEGVLLLSCESLSFGEALKNKVVVHFVVG